MKKAAILMAAILAAAWTCAPEPEQVPAPEGAWDVQAWMDMAISEAATAESSAGPAIAGGPRPYQALQVSVSAFGFPGPEIAAGRYYTETGEIEITWTRAGTTDWMAFTGGIQPYGDVTGQLTGTYNGQRVSAIINAEPAP